MPPTLRSREAGAISTVTGSASTTEVGPPSSQAFVAAIVRMAATRVAPRKRVTTRRAGCVVLLDMAILPDTLHPLRRRGERTRSGARTLQTCIYRAVPPLPFPTDPAPMPCLAVVLAFLVPRFTIVMLWIFTGWFRGVFDGWLWPLLGFFFAPLTMLWYSAVQQWYGGVWGTWQVVGLVIAILLDLSPGAGKKGK